MKKKPRWYPWSRRVTRSTYYRPTNKPPSNALFSTRMRALRSQFSIPLICTYHLALWTNRGSSSPPCGKDKHGGFSYQIVLQWKHYVQESICGAENTFRRCTCHLKPLLTAHIISRFTLNSHLQSLPTEVRYCAKFIKNVKYNK